MIKRRFLGLGLVLGLLAAGCGEDSSSSGTAGTGGSGFEPPEFGDMNLRDYVEHLLDDDEPLESFFEEEGEGPFVPCTPADFNAGACEAAVNPPEM